MNDLNITATGGVEINGVVIPDVRSIDFEFGAAVIEIGLKTMNGKPRCNNCDGYGMVNCDKCPKCRGGGFAD